MGFCAGGCFGERQGQRQILPESLAAEYGMVAAIAFHLRHARRDIDNDGWIRMLLEGAENERTHLQIFAAIARPAPLRRLRIAFLRGVFFAVFFVLYLVAPRAAHRVVAYREEDAVPGYTQYLAEIDAAHCADIAAPEIALRYWGLPAGARLSDVLRMVRADRAHHRDLHHVYADTLAGIRTARDGALQPRHASATKGSTR